MYLEKKIKVLDLSVTTNKKGMKNAFKVRFVWEFLLKNFKSLFKRNDRIEDPKNYELRDVEVHMRLLPDLLFVTENYT